MDWTIKQSKFTGKKIGELMTLLPDDEPIAETMSAIFLSYLNGHEMDAVWFTEDLYMFYKVTMDSYRNLNLRDPWRDIERDDDFFERLEKWELSTNRNRIIEKISRLLSEDAGRYASYALVYAIRYYSNLTGASEPGKLAAKIYRICMDVATRKGIVDEDYTLYIPYSVGIVESEYEEKTLSPWLLQKPVEEDETESED